jgi:intein/homing endonuclease
VNDKIYNDLLKFGLTPNKSLTLQFPDVPKEYVRHFVRGCWDGDGSVYFEKRANRIKASYVSGSKKFIEGMVGALSKDGFVIKTIYTNKRKTPSYYFRLNLSQMRAFYHYLYDDVAESQYLVRKYNLFKLASDREVRASPVRESEEKIDLTEYFPNLSSDERIRLFGEEWLIKHTRHKK